MIKIFFVRTKVIYYWFNGKKNYCKKQNINIIIKNAAEYYIKNKGDF